MPSDIHTCHNGAAARVCHNGAAARALTAAKQDRWECVLLEYERKSFGVTPVNDKFLFLSPKST